MVQFCIIWNIDTPRVLPVYENWNIVIACNPYKWFLNYIQENRILSFTRLGSWEKVYDPRHDLSPHVYEPVLAYKVLLLMDSINPFSFLGNLEQEKQETVQDLHEPSRWCRPNTRWRLSRQRPARSDMHHVSLVKSPPGGLWKHQRAPQW
jgi:hypothetical protein